MYLKNSNVSIETVASEKVIIIDVANYKRHQYCYFICGKKASKYDNVHVKAFGARCLLSARFRRFPGGEKAFAIPRGIVIVLGILACITFLVEGAVMDWSGVLLTEAKNMDIALAGTGYAIFSVAMLIMRLLGDRTVQFLGEQKAVIGGSIVTASGFALVVIVDNLYLNAFAFILIGLGCANIVPVFYSLLKYQKDMPISAAVTAITSIAYTGVILGPALLGFVAHGINISAVFELLALLLIIEAVIAKYVFCKLKM